jgi:hypothetical protein
MRNHTHRSRGFLFTLAALALGAAPLLRAQFVADGEVVKLDDFTVESERSASYSPPATSVAGKSSIPLEQNP